MDNEEKTSDDGRQQTADNSPNVRLAGDAEPLGAGPVTVGMETIGELPDEDAQREGFYFEQARLLMQAFPDRYKLIVEKGK